MTTRKVSIRRLAATVGVFALAMSGAFVGAGAASAASTPENTPPGQAGEMASGSLTLHKFAGTPVTPGAHNGTELESVARPPLGGVTFEVSQVGALSGTDCVAIDLTTSEGWDAAQAFESNPAALPAGFCLIAPPTFTGATDAAGVLVVPDLDLGLYFVEETDTANVSMSSVSFYVTIPFASVGTSSTTWLYDVHVYPKNDIEDLSDKTVSGPSANGLGSTVTWTITTRPLGSFNDGAPLTAYLIVDVLDSRLTYVEAGATLMFKTPSGVLMDVDPSYYVAPAALGSEVTVAFTPAGIAWLNALPAGTYFEWVFDTVVTAVDADGDIVNTAYENTGGENTEIGDASTQWGAAMLLKYQAGNMANVLMGAEFMVYNSVEGLCAATEAELGSALKVDGETVFTSDADGIVTIPGLFVGNEDAEMDRTYCVVETAPPVGYSASTTVHTIVVTPGTMAEVNLAIANTPNPGPALPLTGSSGTIMLTVGGLVLISLGAGGVMIRRSRTKQS